MKPSTEQGCKKLPEPLGGIEAKIQMGNVGFFALILGEKSLHTLK